MKSLQFKERCMNNFGDVFLKIIVCSITRKYLKICISTKKLVHNFYAGIRFHNFTVE